MGDFTEFFHSSSQTSHQQGLKSKVAYIGYISQYDPLTNMVRVYDPLNANSVGVCILSNWLQMATWAAAIPTKGQTNPLNPSVPYYGFQFCPFGGSQANAPQQGEQVLVLYLNQEKGYGPCAFMLYNDFATPPGASLPVTNQQMKPGEMVFVSPSGSYFHIDAQGNFNIYTQQTSGSSPTGGNMNIMCFGGAKVQTATAGTQITPPNAGDIDLVAKLNINITAGQDVAITAARDITLNATRDIIMNAGRHLLGHSAGIG